MRADVGAFCLREMAYRPRIAVMPQADTNFPANPTTAISQRAVRSLACGWLVIAFFALPISTSKVFGQGLQNDFGSSPAARPPAEPERAPRREARGLSEFATDELVAEIQVRGNRTVPASRITGQMQTRVGRPFDPRALAADIKKLASLPYFVTVRPLHRSTDEGRVIVLEVVERRALRYVEYLGNKKLNDKKLAEATGLSVGGAIDPYAVEEGKRKLTAVYAENGYSRAHVEILEGAKPSDHGVVYSINEGPQEKIWSVEFEGNQFASDGQLKNKIQSKPGIAWLFGGKLRRERLDADVRALTSYYRSFGFFRAKVGRTVELNEDGKWATIRFAIDEGPRYAVRNVTINGVEVFEEADVQSGVKLGSGQLFEQAKMQADLSWLQDLYGSRGYIFADIKAETLFLEEPGKIDLVYNIEEGERWRVGRIIVNINGEESHTRLPVAINRLSVRPGEILDTQKLRDSERRLTASTIFNANPSQGATPKITYRPSEETKRRLAEEEKSKSKERKGVFRGQSPTVKSPAVNRARVQTTYKPPVPDSTVWDSIYASQGNVSGAPNEEWAPRREYRAEKAPANEGVFRGQSPMTTTYPGAYPTARSSNVRVQQSVGSSPESAFANSGSAYANPAAPANNVYGASNQADAHYDQYSNPSNSGYGGIAVGATGPDVASVGAQGVPVQQLGVAEPAPATPVQYAPAYPTTSQPTINAAPPTNLAPPTYGQATAPAYQPVDGNRPMVPVNTALFPSQVYAPTPVPPPNDPFADLVVNLEETQTGRFMVGVAVNSDAGVVGQISLDERNFDWRRIPRSWQDLYDGTAFRGGGQRFRLEAAPGTEVQRYLASWQEPYLLDSPISLNLSGSYYDRQFNDWDEQRIGGRIGLGYQWVDRDLSGMLTYRGERVNFSHALAAGTVTEYDEVAGDNSLHGFGVRLVNDTRDNPFLATSGYFVSASVEQVLGSFSYARAELDARTYVLLKERADHTGRHVMTFQTRLGFTGSDTPVYDRFYAGGFSTMRGFDFRGASPLREVGGAFYEVGGDFMLLNTLEYMFPITADDMINGVVFVDHGTVNESISLDNYRVAPGVGLRVTVPAMGPAPIALDFAWDVSKSRGDDDRVFTFNVGFQR